MSNGNLTLRHDSSRDNGGGGGGMPYSKSLPSE